MRKNEVNLFKKMLWMSMMVPMLLSLSLFSAETVNIMPLGDSITNENYRDDKYNAGGAEEIPEANRTAYRDDLWNALQGGGYTVDFVGSLNSGGAVMSDPDHEGYNGLTDEQMDDNITRYLENARDAGTPVDIALLHIGTNGNIGDESAASVDSTLQKIKDYGDSAGGAHVKVILARIINCWQDWDDTGSGSTKVCDAAFSSHINTFNDNVVSIAEARIANGEYIVIVDIENGAGFVYDATDMIDDLHPNDAGYAKMANVWYDALEANIPTHQWKLEEATQPYIDTYRDANGACGALTSVCPTQTGGIIGSAQSFNGADASIDVTDDGTFDWADVDSFTVEFWMKPDSTTNLQVAIGRHEGTSGNGSWWVGREGSKVKLSIGENITSSADIDITGTQWTHVVAIKDISSNQIRLYINGVEDSSTAIISSVNFVGSEPVNIGWFDASFWFDGTLDEMTVYNGVLSADQIKQHYDAGNIPLEIISNPVTSAEVNVLYTYDVNSNDVSATFSLTVNPGWMSINSNTGEITGTPLTVGKDAATVTADDGSGTVDQSFVVKVRDTASLPNGMEHYWKLNESTGDTTYIDEYNGATDATCSANCPTQEDPGQVDEAQDFSIADSDLDVPDDDSFDWAAGDSFTVEFWMKPNDTSGTEVAIGRRNGSANAWWVGRDGNKVKVDMGDSITSTADIDITGNQWTHVAVVKEAGTKIRLYINGVEDSNIADTSGGFSGTDPVNIGWFFDGFYFQGALDEIAIFNSALPANEIDAHYKNGLAGNGFDNLDVTAPVITLTGANPQEIPVGDAYTELGATAQDDVDGDVSANIVIDASAVDTSTVGSYAVTYDVNDTAGNAATETRTVNVVDNIAPVITLTGAATINLLVGDTYTEEGATCTDNYDATCTVVIGGDTVDTSTVGNYTVTYDATDASGNTATQVLRTVNVTVGIILVIPLNGDNPYTVEVHSTYTDPGASATDIEDGTVPVTDDSASINTTILGDQTVTYTATDSNGNTSQATRTVKVVDTTAPVITLTGSATINLLLGETYTEQGATCTDNYDTTCTVITGGDTVDTSTVGSYIVTYNATDTSGNAAQVSRTVNVTATPSDDTTPPVITLNGTDPMEVLQGSTFTDPGATATDDVDGAVSVVESGTVDTSIVGSYTRTYTATDAAGNIATKTRAVNVVASSWYTFEDDGSTVTYTTADGESAVEVDFDQFNVTANDWGVVFIGKTQSSVGGCLVQAYITMKSNGDMIAGYTHEGNGCTQDTNGYAPGTKASVGSDMHLLIETPLADDLILGGK